MVLTDTTCFYPPYDTRMGNVIKSVQFYTWEDDRFGPFDFCISQLQREVPRYAALVVNHPKLEFRGIQSHTGFGEGTFYHFEFFSKFQFELSFGFSVDKICRRHGRIESSNLSARESHSV